MRLKNSAYNGSFYRLPVAVCLSSLFLASCGGGGSGDSNPGQGGGSVVVEGSGEAADDIDTRVLLRQAASETSNHLGKNITSMQRLGGNSSSLGLLLDATTLGSMSSNTSDGESVIAEDVLTTDTEDNIGDFIDALLGLDEQGAEITREGNRITIDPDDAAFCQSELMGESATATEFANCQTLVSDVLIVMDAATEDSGLITVTFAQQDLMLVGYAPTTVNYELKLPGLQSLLTQAEQLDGEMGSVPNMQGALRFSATVSNDTVNAESGTFSVSVTEALSIVDNDGTNVSLQPSTLLSVSSDAATNTGSMEINIGALSASTTSEDMSLSAIAFSGLTARMDVSNDGNNLLVSNVGIGNGPLIVTVDSVEQIRFMLQTFGFSVEGDTGTITLSDNLDMQLSLGQLNSVAAQAASGTTFTTRDDGVSQVSAGGPLVMSVTADSNGTPVSDTLSIGAGDCFGTDTGEDSALPFTIVDCGL